MIGYRKALGKQAFRVVLAGVAVSCLGAAVAAPLTITPRNKLGSFETQAAVEHTTYAPLASGPSLQLGHPGAGMSEDCVNVTRITGPDGTVYATRGMVCGQ